MPDLEQHRKRFDTLQKDIEDEKDKAEARRKAAKIEEIEAARRRDNFWRDAKPRLHTLLKEFNEQVLNNKGIVHDWTTAIPEPDWIDDGYWDTNYDGDGSYVPNGGHILRKQYSFACL